MSFSVRDGSFYVPSAGNGANGRQITPGDSIYLKLTGGILLQKLDRQFYCLHALSGSQQIKNS
jgi:hypothetical protein